jgi:putative flavoprotein involved in K+ transport
MRSIDSVIIGGGQAGLAMSRSLTDRGIEHVVLERGRIAERWRSERWDSLTLLTPRWLSRLPGYAYEGPDPDGYMDRAELIEYLEGYARSFPAPVETGVTVTSVAKAPCGYRIDTDQGTWLARNVVIATGACDTPLVPSMATGLSGDIHQVTPNEYKNPGQLPEGGVLVVGASATGVQLADEIHASGRPVTVAVGRHTRLPRTYRGRDILWWLDTMGVLDERTEDVADLEVSRHQPSMQLVGRPDRRTLDLSSLLASGVRLVGRAAGADGARMRFEDDLVETIIGADAKLAKLQARVDEFIDAMGAADDFEAAQPFALTDVPDAPSGLDLKAAGIRTVVWATGFRREYPWLRLPILDSRGEIVHDRGVTPLPGVYVMGLPFMRRRSSTFIAGQAQDAPELAEHLDARRHDARSTITSHAA